MMLVTHSMAPSASLLVLCHGRDIIQASPANPVMPTQVYFTTKERMFKTIVRNYNSTSYTHLMPDLGIGREPTDSPLGVYYFTKRLYT